MIVIGGGPAGVTAALRARELGASAILGLAARRLVRELGVMPLAPQWRTLGRPPAEWERHEG